MALDSEQRQLIEKMSFELRHISDPPRIIFARERGSKAPYRFRVPTGNKKYERRMLSQLRSRGLNARVWTPKPEYQPSRWDSFWQSIKSIVSDIALSFSRYHK